jgi:predicted nucleic acid-binding protein
LDNLVPTCRFVVTTTAMRRHRIRAAFTFDRHFKLAGFEVIGLK